MYKKIMGYMAAALALAAGCVPQPQGERAAALADTLWAESEWISPVDAPVIEGRVAGANCRAADGANWFACDLKNPQRVERAVWMTTGLGVYDIFVNGRLIGEEVLKPGFTHYEKTKRSYTYDITDVFNCDASAENCLSAQVTPGWWADKIVTPGGHDGMIGRKCAFRSILQLTYADGTTAVFGTDPETWRAGISGPVTHAAIFDGEAFDARRPVELYNLGEAEVNTEFSGEILPSEGAEIFQRRDLALKPVQAYVWKDIENSDEENYGKVVIARSYRPGAPIDLLPGETLVVDFGQNCAGVPEFVFKAGEGTALCCLPAELLNDGCGAKSRGMDGPEGSIHRRNLRIQDWGIRLDYVFAGAKGYETFCPRETFFGFRFISVTATAPVRIRAVRSIPVSSIAEGLETGRIQTGSELVNKLISNTLWGQRSNYLSVPTDCPQRDERLGWTADTQVFSETGTFFANTDAFFHKWMRDMRDTQNALGAFPGVAPQAQYGAEPTAMMRLGWADAGIIVPWTVWKQFGDVSIIEENWDAMDRFMTHIDDNRYDHTALAGENGNYQWADWLSYEALESCSGKQYGAGGLLPEAVEYWSYLGASYWAIDAGMMADMAAASGRDAAPYEAMAASAKDYLRERFLTPEGLFRTEVLNTMQTPALFALKNSLVEGEARDAMCRRLRENFAAHENCLQTGFLGTSILMETLTQNGMADIAYELLFQRKNPSWLYSVDNGATTIWERWNSYMIEKGMGPRGMNSFNHYAYGCVCAWIWKSVAGIAADPACPGFRHIIMKPIPDRRLGFVDASYDSAAGRIESSWRYKGDEWIWDFTIPDGATASVTLPGSDPEEYGPGSYRLTRTL